MTTLTPEAAAAKAAQMFQAASDGAAQGTADKPTDQTFDQLVTAGGTSADLTTATAAAPPQLITDAAGHTRLVLTWTKNTKAHVGTAIAAVTGLGEFATQYLPAHSPYTAAIQLVVGVVGLAATWLGIQQVTNLPKK